MSAKGKEFVNVRIPQALFDEMQRVINQVPITESDGSTKRVSEPYGLTNSNTALTNTILLALLSSIIPLNRVTLLTQITPGVTMTYVNEAKKRLVPDQSLNIPVSEIVDISTRQREGFEKVMSAMETMYMAQQIADNKVIEDQGSALQLLSFYVGANTQSNVSDPKTFNDRSANAVRKAIGVYGEQHLSEFKLNSRLDKKQSE